MRIYNLSYGFGRKQDRKKLHKLTFCSVFWGSCILGETAKILMLLQAFSTRVRKRGPFGHDGSGAARCSSTRCHARLAAFPVPVAADAMGDASFYGASNQKD